MYCKTYFNLMLLYISTILHLKVHGIRIHRYSDRDSLSSGISKKDCSKIRCGNDTESWEVDPQNDHEDQGWWWHLALKTIHTKKVFFEKKLCFCITGSGLFQLIYTYICRIIGNSIIQRVFYFSNQNLVCLPTDSFCMCVHVQLHTTTLKDLYLLILFEKTQF